MDASALLRQDLNVPDACYRNLSESRFVCLVHGRWLKLLQRHHVVENVTADKYFTSDECQLHLAASYKNVPAPWTRVCVKVIQKSNSYIHSTPNSCVCSDDEEPTFSEMLITASQHAWQLTSDTARRRYHSAVTCGSTHKVAPPYKDLISCTRTALKRIFNCDIIPLMSKQSELSGNRNVPETPICRQSYMNLTGAYAVIESEQAFHVIQPYVQYSLYDTVTFSPTQLQRHRVTSLFILYQILRAIQQCHDMGVSVGDLRLSDILIDSKLWVQVAPVHLGHSCGEVQGRSAALTSGQADSLGMHHEEKQNRTDEHAGCDPSHTDSKRSCSIDQPMNGMSTQSDLQEIVQMWTYGKISNFDYLMLLNRLAGRRSGDPNHHPILPWVMNFSQPDSGYRDLTKSKFRLNKGDYQLDLTYDNSLMYGPSDEASRTPQDPLLIHHHITDFLSDITYYVYKARRTPKSVLCAHVRKRWVPNEYPMSMQRLYDWTPDECIPEFYTDPTMFTSLHHDLPDLELPSWARSAEEFLARHVAVLESDHVSRQLHHWIDLTFGYKLSGSAAVQAKNVCLQLVDDHTEFLNHGVVQLFTHPHPPKLLSDNCLLNASLTTGMEDVLQKEHKHREDKHLHHKKKHPPSGSTGDAKKTADKQGQRAIVLPDGYEPLKELEQLESMYEFCLDTTKKLPQPLQTASQPVDPWLLVQARDMQAFGCLMVELFLSSKTRVLGRDSTHDKRFRLVRELCKNYRNELPRSTLAATEALLGLSETWHPDQADPNGPMFRFDKLMKDGLPPPTATVLLHSEFGIMTFPRSFKDLYSLLYSVKELGHKMQEVEGGDDVDKATQLKLLARRKVALFASYFSENVLTRDTLDLLMPYVTEFFEDTSTSVQAMSVLFDAVARCMGRCESVSRLLHLTMRLFTDDTTTPKHMRLYHRSFVLQLLVRFGLESFLTNFSTLLIEACAGYKDFCGHDYISRQMSDVFLAGTSDNTGRCYDNRRPGKIVELGPTEEYSGDDVFAEEMSLDGDSEEATVALHYDGASSDSGAVERDDGRSSTSAEHSGDGVSNGSGEDVSSGSAGRPAVSNEPQFIDGHLHVDGEAAKRSPSTGSENDDDGAGDCEAEIEIARSMVRSETEEFASSIMDAGGNVEYNVKDVATETVKWLAHRLGPVLTAKYLSRNLLRMLALCYLGEEQLAAVDDMNNELSTTHVSVVGDEHATRVLDCLTCIAILYGEHIILLQYFQHIREQISQAVKKLTSRAEAGLVGCLQLLIYILPYLSDSTLMDILQETIFKDIILPILKIVSSVHISFPTCSRARSVICYKIIDALYVISLRIGFEMTRDHMTFVLQKFFAAFNRVYEHTDEETTDLPCEATVGSPNIVDPDKQALEESLYFEIKMDSQTNEYHIGTPIAVDSLLRRERQNSGSSTKHSLSPPVHEDIEEIPQFGEVNREQILAELWETFTPQLAHAAYIPFCKLAGGIHMEQNLINDDLIRQLCASHDRALSQQQFANTELLTPDSPPYTSVTSGESSDVQKDGHASAAPDDIVENFTVAGNKFVESGTGQTKVSLQRMRCRSGEPPVDDNTLRSPEMDINKQRHLKGNWLAYWEHEVGLSERQDMFDFKQIKLQTFTGHTSSVRAITVLDNENSFMSASKDKTVKLWSLRSFGDGSERVGCQWTYNKHRKPVFTVSFIESIRLAVSNDSSVHVWDPFVGMCLRQYEASKNNPVTAMTPMASPSSCVMTATADAILRLLDVRMEMFTCEFKCTTTPAGLIRCIAPSPDGQWLAVGYSTGVISVLDARTGLVAASWKGHEGEILQMKAFDNTSFVTSSFDQSMTLWNAEDGKAVSVFKGLTEPVHCISFYRGMMLTATTAKRVGVYPSLDSKTNFTSTKLRSDTFPGVLTTMAVLPANRLLLLGADNGAIRLLA